MGLMDNLEGRLEGAAGSELSKLLSQNPMTSHLLSMFGGQGPQGLQGLVSAFQQHGLGNIVSSWIGNGPNQPVSGDQVEQVLGQDRIQQLANKTGSDPRSVKQRLAELLPALVDKMTPNGKIEPQSAGSTETKEKSA